MPEINDYHAYNSTRGDGGGSGNGLGCLGCSGGPFTWIIGIIIFLWIVGKLSG